VLPDCVNCEPAAGILGQEPIDQITELLGAARFDLTYILDDIFPRLFLILATERSNAVPEFVYEDAEAPQIHHFVVAFVSDWLYLSFR
jgi:hypothetical protein